MAYSLCHHPAALQVGYIPLHWLQSSRCRSECHLDENHLLWHMSHGITFHLALKNSNHYYILWSCSTNLPASTTTGPSYKPAQTHHHYAPPAGPLSRNFLRFSCHHWCTSHNFRASTRSICCNSHLMKSPAFSYLASHPETLAQIIMPEINF